VLRSAPNGIQRPVAAAPFDHTSIIRTLRDRFDPNGTSLTGRDAAAPSLDLALNLDQPGNDGPDQIDPPPYAPTADELQKAKDMPPNDLQRSLCALTAHLPQAGGDVARHIDDLKNDLLQIVSPQHSCVADAAGFVRENLNSFLGNF
jgi:hypothetical protein